MDGIASRHERVPAESIAESDRTGGDFWWVGYWRGYEQGLKRARFGDALETDPEYRLWITLADCSDPPRAEFGRGYRDGLVAAEHASSPPAQ